MLKRTTTRVPVRTNNNIAGKVGLVLGSLHVAAFVVLAVFIQRSADPQAALLWGIFAIIDFPVSLLYFLGGTLYSHSPEFYKALRDVVYFPYLVHGMFGTVWWYFLPRIVTPRRFGGIW